MATNAWGVERHPRDRQPKTTEEVFFRNDAVSLCLLVNHRARTLRVVDFRAGPSPAKKVFIEAFARREGVEKVFTLVERDEVATWTKLGFVKEGTIPSFYKRSDAFLLGFVVRPVGRAKTLGPRDPRPSPESETRLVVAKPVDEDGEPSASAAPDPRHEADFERAERTVVAAKRAAKDLAERPSVQAKIAVVSEAEARKAVAAAARSGRALTAFEPFGRDVQRRYFVATSRGGFELHASIESQPCFDNAYLELLERPRAPAEVAGAIASVRALVERLRSEGAVSCFSLAPSDDVDMAVVFLQSGFRRTGVLLSHLAAGSSRRHAILWSRKLATATDE